MLGGAFADLVLPHLGSLTWDTSQLCTSGLLGVNLPGDFNFDSSVDAADYVLWRKTDGTPAGYDVWRALRQIAGNGSGTSANVAVPEPAIVMLLMLPMSACCLPQRQAAYRVPRTR